MGKSVFVIDTPECCGECPMSGTGACRKWSMKDVRSFPKTCPLKEVPQGLVEENGEFSKEYVAGYNACIEKIFGEDL